MASLTVLYMVDKSILEFFDTFHYFLYLSRYFNSPLKKPAITLAGQICRNIAIVTRPLDSFKLKLKVGGARESAHESALHNLVTFQPCKI